MGQDGQPPTLKIDVGGVKSPTKRAAASCISLYEDALLTLTLSLVACYGIAGQYINEILVIFLVLVHNRHVFTSAVHLEIGILLEKAGAGCLCSRRHPDGGAVVLIFLYVVI